MAKDGEPRQLGRRGDKTMRTGRARAPLSDRSPYRVSSMSALIAFESAARHGSFSHAARELGTSQSAISRLIARLEDDLSARLFERSRIGVSLTDAGLRFHEAVLLALGALRDAAAEVAEHSGEDGTDVAIACPGELSHLFVMQRYEALKAALGDHVRIRILAHTNAAAPAPPETAADVILTWDAGTGTPRHRVTITTGAVGLFCSPGYAAAHARVLNGPAAGWAGLTLLDLAEPDEGGASWERWLEAIGRPTSAPRYEVVGSHAQALEAAVAGRGIVLGWRHLIGRHVEAGTLVMQAGGFVETGRCFHAVLTAAGRQRPLARACLAFFGGAARHRAGWAEP